MHGLHGDHLLVGSELSLMKVWSPSTNAYNVLLYFVAGDGPATSLEHVLAGSSCGCHAASRQTSSSTPFLSREAVCAWSAARDAGGEAGRVCPSSSRLATAAAVVNSRKLVLYMYACACPCGKPGVHCLIGKLSWGVCYAG